VFHTGNTGITNNSRLKAYIKKNVECQKNTKTNALCHQRAKFRNVTAGGAYGSH